MKERIDVRLGDVPKSLVLPLRGRAQETKKSDPMLKDPAAIEILDRVDFDVARIARNLIGLSRTWIMRSVCVDRAAAEVLAECPSAAVVDLGCGLDTAFDRLDNGRLTWYGLDLPDVAELRNRLMRKHNRRTTIAASAFDEAWLKEIKPAEKNLLIAAGVTYYFDEAGIKSLFKRQADAFPGCEVLFDVCSSLGMKTADQMVIKRTGWDERPFLKRGSEGRAQSPRPGPTVQARENHVPCCRSEDRNPVDAVRIPLRPPDIPIHGSSPARRTTPPGYENVERP